MNVKVQKILTFKGVTTSTHQRKLLGDKWCQGSVI